MTDDDPTLRLCERLLAVLDENAALRDLVCDMAARMPLSDEQRRLVDAAFRGQWT